MRKILLATAAATCLALTACHSDNNATKSPTTPPPTAPSPTTPAPSPTAPDTGPAAQAFGEPSRTVGAGTVGILEITPNSVVYVKKGGGQTAKYGTFAIVTMDEKSLSANPASETRLAKGGGWHWIAPDGHRIAEDSGNAGRVALARFRHGDAIVPGAHQLRAKVFDLTPAQANGGRIDYIDGTASADRWTVPATDSGPHVADVKKELIP
ncbi:hypothetical protein ACGFRG_03595 [Streptomyces sp. NPDC048696]|uniref:hypothetical protein n=1 Tax=Streptomyces sp. NPDC048696 TaxID=3365585 RepID=UPI0037217A49